MFALGMLAGAGLFVAGMMFWSMIECAYHDHERRDE